ncbi:MAG: hypothetical protein N2317_04985 [Syntrophales bacterium]|nr:hypothetical protein [Syntrophales bacterium]
MNLNKFRFIVLLFVLLFVGCSFKIHHYLVPDYEKKQIRLIAVLPVEADSCDPELADLLRRMIIDALYFKGYPKISIQSTDEKVIASKPEDLNQRQLLEPHIGVDAILRAKLVELSTKFNFIFATVNIRVDLELFSTRTGELLWGTSLKESEIVMDVTPSRLRLKTAQFYELSIQTIVERAMKTFPEAFGMEEA